MNQSDAEMSQRFALGKSRRAEGQPSASTGAETSHGVQRVLRFEEGEEPQAEETAPDEEQAESGAESSTKPAHEKARDAAPEAEKPVILGLETTYSDGSNGHVRHLAVALDGLAQPRDEGEQERFVQAATAWHRDLLGLLSQWTSGTTFRLRYQAAPSQDWTAEGEEDSRLRISLIVTVEARSAGAAEARAHRILQELRRFLKSTGGAGNQMYGFRPVTSEEALRQRLVPFGEGEVVGGEGLCLSRRTIPLEDQGRSGMGFGAASREPTAPEVPAATPSATGHHLTPLVHTLLRQGPSSLLDVALRPTRLGPEEMRRLRSLARGEATGGTVLSGREEDAIVAFSEDLIEQAGSCFEAQVTLAQARRPVSEALKAAATRSLFGGGAKTYETSLEERGGLLRPAGRPSPAPAEPGPKRERPPAENGGPESREAGAGRASSRLRKLYAPEQAARVFRLSAPTPEGIPGIQAVHPASRQVPPALPDEGPLLGEKTAWSGLEKTCRAVRMRPEDMFHHVYILGQTGTGKTTMLSSMLMERLEAGSGVGLIDPHGDLYDQIREAIPPRRREDVILFDPASEESDTKLNLLEYDPERPRQRSTLINELLQILDQEYDLKETGGPIFERYMRNALLLVMDDPRDQGTLLDVVRLFQDRAYREDLLEACDNEQAVQFWREAENTPTTGELPSPENMSIYVTSKLSRFLDDDYLRSLVDRRRSTIDFQTVIDEGKILLVKMQKGTLGQIGVRMFGTIVVARLMMAALSRESIPETERRPFYLFVDEFQNFTTPTIASLLSEARKYRLSLTLANQTLYQLDEEIVDAVLGNVGSLISLRPGVKDYEQIEPYVSPPFRREDLVNLPNYRAVGRILTQGEPTRPFLFNTIP